MANVPNPGGGSNPPAPTKTPPANQNSGVLGLPSNKSFYLWGVSAMVLIGLADPYPNVAIFFTWLLILGVLLMNSGDYIGLLQTAFGG